MPSFDRSLFWLPAKLGSTQARFGAGGAISMTGSAVLEESTIGPNSQVTRFANLLFCCTILQTRCKAVSLFCSVWQPWIMLETGATLALNMAMLGNPSNLDALQNSACIATDIALQHNTSQEVAVGIQLKAGSRAVSSRLPMFI